MSEKNTRIPSLFIPSVLLGAGIALGFTLLGTYMYKSIYFFKTEDRNIKVRGLAEEIVKSDHAVLSFSIHTYGESPESTYKTAQMHTQAVRDFLIKSGYAPSEIESSPQTILDRTDNHYGKTPIEKTKRYLFQHDFLVKTNKVDDANSKMNALVTLTEKGVNIARKSVIFKYSDFAKKRPELLKKAALDAQSAAKQVAKEMSVTLGDLQGSHQSNVEIHSEEDNAQGERYSDHEKSLYKKLRVIFTTSWGIKPTHMAKE